MKIIFLTITAILVSVSSFNYVYSQDDLRIWKEFIEALKNGRITGDNIRPHKQLGDKYKSILLGYLDTVRTQATAEDWTTEPEVVRTDNRIQYIIPWTTGDQRISYCFSFETEGTRWYFQHLEAIFIRLDKVTQFPTSDFPDVSESQKNWVREELYWSFIILNLYLPVEKERGKTAALGMLKDGGGYFVSAKTWVPFASPHKAFILYLCWEQAKLRGNDVILEKLEEGEAVVKLNTQFFALYFRAAHLKTQIPVEDYRKIFETIWLDRASSAGWNLDIQYSEDYSLIMNFKLKK